MVHEVHTGFLMKLFSLYIPRSMVFLPPVAHYMYEMLYLKSFRNFITAYIKLRKKGDDFSILIL